MAGNSEVTLTELDLSRLSSAELTFLKEQTGISDEDALKKHINQIQNDATKVVPYECIKTGFFTSNRITRHPAYIEVLQLGKNKPGAIFVELAACFGNDVRQLVADGYPTQNIIASDLHPEFWALGHKLFKATSQTFRVPFLAGDVFDNSFIGTSTPVYGEPLAPQPINLSELKSLSPLHGRVSVVRVAAFFHLFEEEGQLKAARALASLLSPEPGSMIIGDHIAAPEPKSIINPRGEKIFLHSPDSWKALWDGTVFEKGAVAVEVMLHDFDWRHKTDQNIKRFDWTVRRL